MRAGHGSLRLRERQGTWPQRVRQGQKPACQNGPGGPNAGVPRGGRQAAPLKGVGGAAIASSGLGGLGGPGGTGLRWRAGGRSRSGKRLPLGRARSCAPGASPGAKCLSGLKFFMARR